MIQQTWKTTYSQSSCLHSFMICGVLYVIGTSSGEVDYVYNTNGVTGKGKYVSIGFDQNRLALNGLFGDRKKSSLSPRRRFDSPAGLRSSSRSFLSYNFTSVMYNPRDRLLYAWEASSSKAVYYYLHFDGSNPAKSKLSQLCCNPNCTLCTVDFILLTNLQTCIKDAKVLKLICEINK